MDDVYEYRFQIDPSSIPDEDFDLIESLGHHGTLCHQTENSFKWWRKRMQNRGYRFDWIRKIKTEVFDVT